MPEMLLVSWVGFEKRHVVTVRGQEEEALGGNVGGRRATHHCLRLKHANSLVVTSALLVVTKSY